MPRERSICIGRSCANLRPHVFTPSFRPTETPIPGPSADAQVGPRLPLGERASPPHHTGHHASLAPTDKPALTRPCGLFPEPRLLMPLDAPACPVAAHRAPDAPHFRLRQRYGELAVECARPGQQALAPCNKDLLQLLRFAPASPTIIACATSPLSTARTCRETPAHNSRRHAFDSRVPTAVRAACCSTGRAMPGKPRRRRVPGSC